MRGVIAIVLWSALSGSALAQSAPDAAGVRQRLHSASPSEVAWAAFDAGTFQIHEAIPDLIAVLNSHAPEELDLESGYLVAAVLDALVQIRPIPGEPPLPELLPLSTLERYYPRWPVQSLILFGRLGPERDPLVLNLLQASSGHSWFAFANLLIERAPPGFAATVLKGMKLELALNVVEPGSGLGNSGADFVSVMSGDGIGTHPRNFPPQAIYELEDFPRAESILLSTGPHPMYYSRFVTTAFQFGLSNSTRGGPTARDRLAYLEAIRPGYHFGVNAQSSATIEWRNERQFNARVSEERKKIADSYDRMLALLMEEHYLTGEEVRTRPMDLKIEVVDQRTDRSNPLPDVH